jgi:hypothetical protein
MVVNQGKGGREMAKGDKETGESPRGFSEAADAAAAKIGNRPGTWKVEHEEVVVEHHSPSHIQVYRVTLKQQ